MKLMPAPLEFLFGNYYVARGVRYFLIVIFAGVLWPMCFSTLAKIKIGALDSLGKRIKNIFFSKKVKKSPEV